MSEIRFNTDELFEEKISFLMNKLKMRTKKALFEYLLNKQFESEKQKGGST